MNLCHVVLISALSLAGWVGEARASDIHIEKVVGQVWYVPVGSTIPLLLRADMDIAPGLIRTDLTSILYGSPRFGSSFRLAAGTSVEFQSNGPAPRPGGGMEPVVAILLTQGKITMTGRPGPGRYDIEAKGGKIGAGAGLCVVCSHGEAAHVYVAQGVATLYPRQGVYHLTGLKMFARPTVAVLNSDGVLITQPLSQFGPGEQSCLLSGVSPGGGGAVENGLPNPGNLPGNPPVSETQ